MSDLRRTPLYARHLEAGAKTADFGGWDMPTEYEGVLAEHAAVRTAVGLFDVSHMGKVRIHGAGAKDALNAVLANDLDRIADGQAQYSMLLNEAGGVVDDLIVYRWSDNELFVIPNAANAQAVVAALQAALPGIGVDDHHHDVGIIAVQGPRSADLVARLGLPIDMDYMAMARGTFGGGMVVVARTGYTGELGFELMMDAGQAVEIWDALMARGGDLGVVPAGLGARDTLRTEMGYPLHGQDISPTITPVEAMLGWAIGWDKDAFTGRDAIAAQRSAGPTRRLRGLLALDRGIPRPHMEVRAGDGGDVVGEVTSGTFSPTLRQGIALALLDAGVSVDDEVVVDVRGRPSRFRVVKPPFVQASTR